MCIGEIILEPKDWILLIVPIVFNGMFVVLLQYKLSARLKKKDERNSLRLKAFSEFLSDIESLKSSIIDTLLVIHKENILKEITDINSSRIKLNKCYQNKDYHLNCVSEEYVEFEENWNAIARCFELYTKSMDKNDIYSSYRWKLHMQVEFKPLLESLTKLDKAVNENY